LVRQSGAFVARAIPGGHPHDRARLDFSWDRIGFLQRRRKGTPADATWPLRRPCYCRPRKSGQTPALIKRWLLFPRLPGRERPPQRVTARKERRRPPIFPGDNVSPSTICHGASAKASGA
jgi:hypothetical protein